MTVRFLENAGAADQVADLIDSCRKAPWENVTKIWVYANKVQGDPAVPGDIQHITKADGKIHDDPTLDVRAYLERCRSLQREKKKPITFIFVVIGIRTANVKGRSKVQEPEEVEFFRKNVRIGDEEDEDDDRRGPVDGMKVMQQLVAPLTEAMKVMDERSRGREEWMWERVKEAQGQVTAMGGQMVEMAKVRFEHERYNAEREDKRQEKRDDVEAALEHDRMKYDRDKHVWSGLERLGHQWGPILWAHFTKMDGPTPGPTPGAAPSSGSTSKDLATLLARVDMNEKSKLRKLLGETVWRLLEHAAEAPTEEAARAELLHIRELAKGDLTIGAKILETETILGAERYATLFDILKRAGVLNFG